jgi:hypothetical protein
LARFTQIMLLIWLNEDVYITSLWIKIGEDYFHVHVYHADFDLLTATALKSPKGLRFVFPRERKDYHTYEEGALTDLFFFSPFSFLNREALESFEQR